MAREGSEGTLSEEALGGERDVLAGDSIVFPETDEGSLCEISTRPT